MRDRALRNLRGDAAHLERLDNSDAVAMIQVAAFRQYNGRLYAYAAFESRLGERFYEVSRTNEVSRENAVHSAYCSPAR